MSKRPLLEYEIEGEGIHCVINLFVGDTKVGVLDTGTKYEDKAEEQLANFLKEKFFTKVIDISNY